MNKKQNVLAALSTFIRQRSGMEFANYGDMSSYRAESRSITKDLHHAHALLAAVAMRDSITAEQIIKAASSAFSGRLTIKERVRSLSTQKYVECVGFESSDVEELTHTACAHCGHARGRHEVHLDYCTGQYFPTEYRKAVCAVLASVMWDHYGDGVPECSGYSVIMWGSRAPVSRHATRADAEAALATAGGSSWGQVSACYGKRGLSAGDYIRDEANREFGRAIASRWFN